MSVYSLKSMLGICTYQRDLKTFRLIFGWCFSADLTALGQVIIELEPNAILVPGIMKEHVQEMYPMMEVTGLAQGEFNYEEGKTLLKEGLEIESELQFSTRFSTDLRVAICAFGPLYRHIAKNDKGPFQYEVGSQEFLLSDLETLRSLQIIKDDYHPSTIKSAGRSKEGFSIFNLMDRTVTRQGRRLLRQWLLQPLQNLSLIQTRQRRVGFFAQNPVLCLELQRGLKEIHDLEKMMGRFENYTEKCSDWKKLHKSVQAWERVLQMCEGQGDILRDMDISKALDIRDIGKLSQLLETSLDLDSSVTQRHPSVHPGVSPELDYLKQSYENLEGVLTKLAQIEAGELGLQGRHSSAVGVVYFPQLGYLVELRTPNPGISSRSSDSTDDLVEQIKRLGYEFQFRTEEAVYYKSGRCRDLDTQFGDLVSMMRDLEGEEVRKLEEQVLNLKPNIKEIGRLTAELDALISLAAAAGICHFTCPDMKEASGIEIINGRHPLVELCINHFIPNDCELTFTTRMGLITGPNNSGKSVYLKMVGIIVYLAHCGSFVPADQATIGLCDRISTRMNVQDAVNFSAFTQEIKRLGVALNGATARSLLLLDELGRNTCAEDGMALVHASISYLSRLPDTPMVLLTTHYRELVTLHLLTESAKLRFFTMEMKELDEPVFLYKLIPGQPMSSLAFHCAKLAGLSPAVLSRAAEVRGLMRTQSPSL